MPYAYAYNTSGAIDGNFEVVYDNSEEVAVVSEVNESAKPVSSLICQDYYVPSVREYYKVIDAFGISLFVVGLLALISTICLFADTFKHVLNLATPIKKYTAFIVAVYPVISIASFCVIIVPRAQLLAEASAQAVFMVAMYQLFSLFVAYCGGKSELLKNVEPKSFNLRVAPCCCYPCCKLPTLTVSESRFKILRFSVLQLPILQVIIYMILLVMWAEEENLYNVNYVYFQPVIILSILTGIWGLNIFMGMVNGVLEGYNIRSKFVVLQLVLLFSKLQALLARIAIQNNWLPCNLPLSPAVYSFSVYNTAMLIEMAILSYVARSLYKKHLPNIPSNSSTPPQHVFTIDGSLDKNGNNTILGTENA